MQRSRTLLCLNVLCCCRPSAPAPAQLASSLKYNLTSRAKCDWGSLKSWPRIRRSILDLPDSDVAVVRAETRDLFEMKILNSILVSAKLKENIISNLPPSSNVLPSSVLTFDLKYNFWMIMELRKVVPVMFVRISNVNKWSTFCR